MLSRAANAMYWMNRYVERAENVARFVHVNLHLVLDTAAGTARQWQPLTTTTGDQSAFDARYGEATRDNVVQFLTEDTSNPNSILSCVMAARENARSIRDIISSEMWEQLNRMYLLVKDATGTGAYRESLHHFYTQVKMASHLFEGLSHATMSHGEGWRYGRLGQLLERADKTSRILDVKYYILLPADAAVGSPVDIMQWQALLQSASAMEMYLKKMRRIEPQRVAAFLILDREFPRAMQFCVSEADQCLRAITGSPPDSFANVAERRLGRLRADMAYMGIDEVLGRGMHEYLDHFQGLLNEVDDSIFDTFFAMRPMEAA